MWQGLPHKNKEKQYETMSSFKVSWLNEGSKKQTNKEFVYLSTKIFFNKDLSLPIKNTSTVRVKVANEIK